MITKWEHVTKNRNKTGTCYQKWYENVNKMVTLFQKLLQW